MLNERKDINLEIGAGINRRLENWITLDITDEVDLKWNLLYGLPFPDGSVSKLFSSHVFEHFSYKESQYLLKECLRVLKPSGEFLITVPNARLYLNSYFDIGESMIDHKKDFYQPAFIDTGSNMDIVNYIFYMDGEHKYMYDETSLLNTLKLAGFKNVSLRDADQILDVPSRVYESIFAIGYK